MASVQSGIGDFDQGSGVYIPDYPSDDELSEVIAPNSHYSFDVREVDGIEDLRRDIREAVFAEDPIKKWSYILKDHISRGNKKVSRTIAIYNLGGSATDCINLGTEHCQVPAEQCYAHRSEKNFPGSLSARRREHIIWTHLDAATWSRAFRRMYERMTKPYEVIRFSESGDFRTRGDILKADEIARRLDDIVDVYTYSASDWLPWREVEHMTVNRSNDKRAFGARRFRVVDSVDEIPDDGIRCPNDLDESVKCGDCRLCIDEDAGDVWVKNFYV
jgi:hypothetical protein